MSEIAIKCEGLSKRYRIGEQERYKALRDVVTDAAMAPFRRIRAGISNGNGASTQNSKRETQESIWALDDVSFEVKQGDVVGIIGRNGAGKSTLLKILSRITKPTKGHAEIHGRVGSLLEVGTGFHPELTGRENIYLNGAILGMRKAEIDRQFDEIVAFAEVEKFIDTPVKRYSSGMHVRLAFAVAAHMQTEILLVDEVLAVGDVAFQKKSLGKMGDVAKGGHTVFLVSHNLAMIQRLCSRAILLDDGRLIHEGSANDCVRHYSAGIDGEPHPFKIASSRGSIAIADVRILDSRGAPTRVWAYDRPLVIEIDVHVKDGCEHLAADLAFYSTDGRKLFGLLGDQFTGRRRCGPGVHKITFRLENPGLSLPEMYLDVGLRKSEMGLGYEVLLDRVAWLSPELNTLPLHALPENLVTPLVEVRWS